MSDCASRIVTIREQMNIARENAPLAAPSSTLVAVSKNHDAASILPALKAGQRVFGENRVQEAADKWPELRLSYPDMSLHLIGPLQSNKTREALALFDVMETLDRPKLADAIAKERENGHAGRCKEFFIQVNTGDEPQKAGISPKETVDFVGYCINELSLPVTGLMCIPPAEEEPALHFGLLRQLAIETTLPNLSMGMSGDFEIAIRFGATHIRVGTAIFGSRA